MLGGPSLVQREARIGRLRWQLRGLELDHSEVLRNSDTVLDAIREAADESRIDCKQRRTEASRTSSRPESGNMWHALFTRTSLVDVVCVAPEIQVFACGESKELFAGTSFTATFLRHHQNKFHQICGHLFERHSLVSGVSGL